jgi:membrane glycosyltransferase
MRATGFEVRVIPVESESWEDNPPTILDYTKRDLRWCQGNMQYWKLVRLPGLLAFSRFQILMGIFMYLAAFAWITMISLFALKVFETEPAWTEIYFGVMLFICSFVIAMMPKITGMLDVVATPGGMARYGGAPRFLASSLAEIVFSMMLAPISALRVSIFMVSLCFGRSVIWSGQQRDVRGLSWTTAIAGMWPQTLFGITVTGLLYWGAPGALIWGAPLLVPLILSAPFAAVTASPAFGRLLARIGLCTIPEEQQVPQELRSLAGADMQRTDSEMPIVQLSPIPSN